MSPERESNEPVREFRLEGVGLAVVGVAIVVLLAGAFWLGRWYESTRPAGAGPDAATGLAGGAEGAGPEVRGEADASEGLTYCDTLEGQEKQAEPGREARPGTAAPSGAGQPEPTERRGDRQATSDGPWFVQVFAGRDRTSAESLATRLGDLGYPVKIHTVREGQTPLYKVGVGGYVSREEAESRVDELKASIEEVGMIQPIVVRADTMEGIAGNHRFLAYMAYADENGLKGTNLKIPAMVVDCDEGEVVVE